MDRGKEYICSFKNNGYINLHRGGGRGVTWFNRPSLGSLYIEEEESEDEEMAGLEERIFPNNWSAAQSKLDLISS